MQSEAVLHSTAIWSWQANQQCQLAENLTLQLAALKQQLQHRQLRSRDAATVAAAAQPLTSASPW
jgi:hypothetical protein